MIVKSISQAWTGVVPYAIGVGVIVVGLLVVFYQGLFWYRYGVWIRYDVADFCSWLGGFSAGQRWHSLPAAGTWVLRMPASIGLISLGALGVWTGRLTEELQR